jgi:predicted GNAT family N-acyltransferase
MIYTTQLLKATHQKSGFSCGKMMLDHYIQKQARQDMQSKVAACFVYSDDDKEVKGYYALSNGSIPNEQIPEPLKRKLPRYQHLPVTLLGRLAVDMKFKGKNIGKILLLDALKRSYDTSGSIGSMAVVVDPMDQDAVSFYTKFGFISLPDSNRMFLPMLTIEQLFK